MSSLTLPENLSGQLDVLLIDNFDSFTWNLYQQLCLLGADVTVIRNDAISPALFPQLKIKHLIISPGPGHPKTDSGISKAAIDYFQGKVPIMGVCMGLECLVDLYGGEIDYAGEIMHGKVSRVRHDNRGCFKDIPQGIRSTRYHSLSASVSTLPDHLAVTAASEDSGVIMGIRHRKFTIEAVQYHPESILSDGGDDLMKNFLHLQGGTWEENPESHVLDKSLPAFSLEQRNKLGTSNSRLFTKIPSILDKIYTQRLKDVSVAQATVGATFEDLQSLLSLNIAPPLISFTDRLSSNTHGQPALIAEIKRASPSKGPISVTTCPAEQALNYALAGAHAVSVLTEPKWFLGSLADMLHARMSVANLPNRPAILRKDFILSRYQILEARIWGADTVLLIVSMLPETLLRDLYKYSVSLGMEPLVEVNNAQEMELALSLSAKVIGVNNRNLHDFKVDMDTTSRLSAMVKGTDVILCALSGIFTPSDVQKFANEGVKAVLIGESLMRAKDTTTFIRELFSLPEETFSTWRDSKPLVKICGIRTKEEAIAVAEAGANMLGLMFVGTSKRFIDLETARDICEAVRTLRFAQPPSLPIDLTVPNLPWFNMKASQLSSSSSSPLLVGVFQNAPLAVILHTVEHCQLDLVQLHGNETAEWASQIPVPVIKVFHVGSGTGVEGITRGGAHSFILLDSMTSSGVSGGSGKVVDWKFAKRVVDAGEIVTDLGASYQEPEITLPATALTQEEVPPINDNTIQESTGVPIEETNGHANGHVVRASVDLIPVVPSKYSLPIILAGGLTPQNVASAIEEVGAWAVDVSSGVETEDGMSKDLSKVQAFIANVRGPA